MDKALDIHVLRESISKVTKILSGRGILVTQRGASAYVESNRKGEPIRVNLPYIPDSASEELINAINGFLDHEVGHLMFSDFKLLAKSANENEALGRLHNILEDPFVEKMMAKRFRGSTSNLENVGRFFLNKYTTPKLEGAIVGGDSKEVLGILMVPAIRAWAGQQVFIDYMSDKWPLIEEFTEKLPAGLTDQINNIASTADSYNAAVAIHKAMVGDEPPEEGGGSKDKTKTIKKKSKSKGGNTGESDEDKGKRGSDESGEESTKPTKRSKDDDDGEGSASETESETKPKKPEPKEEEEKPEEEKPEEEGPGEGEDDEADEPKPEEEPESDKEEEAPKPEEDPESDKEEEPEPDDEEEDESEGELEEEEDEDEDGDSSSPPPGPDDDGETGRGDGLTGEEFSKLLGKDFDDIASEIITDDSIAGHKMAPYLVFTKDYDVIEPPKEVNHFKDFMLEELEESVRKVVGPLQKNLERLIYASERSRWQPGLRRGKINSGALFKLKTGDDRVFRRRETIGKTKNVAVTLLVDLSGSMGYSRRITPAVQATYALAQTLDRINVPYEVLGFTTKDEKFNSEDRKRMSEEVAKMGRRYTRTERVYMPVFKSFDEPFQSVQKKRIAVAPHAIRLANNIDGESVEYAAERLMKRNAEKRVMFVMSDGDPACHTHDDKALRQHLKDVVKRYSNMGMELIGIGIQTDAVKKFYPKSVVLHDVSALPTEIMSQLKHVLLGN